MFFKESRMGLNYQTTNAWRRSLRCFLEYFWESYLFNQDLNSICQKKGHSLKAVDRFFPSSHNIERKASKSLHVVQRERLTKVQGTSRPDYVKAAVLQCCIVERHLLHRTGRHGVRGNHKECAQIVGHVKGIRNALEHFQSAMETWCTQHNSRKSRYGYTGEVHKSTGTRIGATQLRDRADLIAEKTSNSLRHYNLVHTPIPTLQAMKKILVATAAVDKEWEKGEKLPAWQVTKEKIKKDVIEKARKEGWTVHFATLMDLCHLKKLGVGAKLPKIQRARRSPRWCCEGRFWLLRCIHGAGLVSITNDSRESSGGYCHTTWMRRTSEWRSFSLHPSQNGGRSDLAETSQIGVSRRLDSVTTTQVAKTLAKAYPCGAHRQTQHFLVCK